MNATANIPNTPMKAAMAVVRGEDGPHFEVADDGHVDEESEDAGAHEVPESHRHQKIKGPLVGDRDRLAADVAGPAGVA